MMKAIRCAMLSILLALSTTVLIAAPQDFSQSREDTHRAVQNQEHMGHGEKRQDTYHQNNKKAHEHRRQHTIIIQWRTGTPVPKPNNYLQYEIDHKQYPQLSTPSRYQQWIKVDNHFILVNVVTNTILKVIPAE